MRFWWCAGLLQQGLKLRGSQLLLLPGIRRW
jgi:hypothetical protein